ncbi:unnamed protein product, partial [Rotaria sordida]
MATKVLYENNMGTAEKL